MLTGILKQQDDQSVTLLTADESIVIPRGEIFELQESTLSMMPEGLLDHLQDQELRDLLYYLTRPGQAPLIATSDTLGPVFNGRDLAGWYGNPDVWQANADEVIGRIAAGSQDVEVLLNDVLFSNFRLVCRVKLGNGQSACGIQFRGRPEGEKELHGYMLGIGGDNWGRLGETLGRGHLRDPEGEFRAGADDWVQCEIVAVGNRILAAIGGVVVQDFMDPEGAMSGVLGLRIDGGAGSGIRFRDFRVELDPEPELVTVP